MREFEYVLERVLESHLDTEQIIGDIDISKMPDFEWHCTEKPWL
jgi:hypothetical protein